MITEFNKFYKDKRFYLFILVIALFELILQLGFYKPFLKKNSYAANVNRITDHAIDKKEIHNPDILIMGTSVAYYGLSVPLLQEKIKDTGYKIQSTAVPGSELVVQDLILEKVLDELDHVKLLIYVGEITMPWGTKSDLTLPTLAMISQFGSISGIQRSIDFEYEVKADDFAYLLSKSIAYRRDMRDFLLNPLTRFKHLGRKLKNPNNNYYDYENSRTERMSDYELKDVIDCIAKTRQPDQYTHIPLIPFPIPPGSNPEHKKAIFDTCALSHHSEILMREKGIKDGQETEETKMYFKRLAKIYEKVKSKNIKIINIFAPYSYIIKNMGSKERLALWEQELKKINGNDALTVDFQDLFKDKNSDYYCYDVIHLNRDGMVFFTEALGDYLNKNMSTILPKGESK